MHDVESGNNHADCGVGIYNRGSLVIHQALLSGNRAESDGAGGGLSSTGSASLVNTLLADNQANSCPDCAGAPTSPGHNLVQNTLGCSLGGVLSWNILNQDAHLETLGYNGGNTFTHALLIGSSASMAAISTPARQPISAG